MGWSTEDGTHEGHAAAVFTPGDLLSFGSMHGGAMVLRHDLSTGDRAEEFDPANPTVLDGAEAIGWRGICECGWLGPLWERVAAAEHDPAEHRVHVASPSRYGDAPEEIEEEIWGEWSDHTRQLRALETVRATSAEMAAASDRLARAVGAAKAAGHSWTDIGKAAGMSRQAAHERWGHFARTYQTSSDNGRR